MLKLRFLYLLLIPVIMFVSGCSKDDDPVTPPPTVNEAQTLVAHLEGSDGGFINSASCPSMETAANVYTNLTTTASWYIIDVRAQADYNAGHIQGAVNVTIANILSYYKANNLQTKEKVILTCYTGQSAAFAVSLLRLSGFTNVFDLKWGMCSWSDPARWNNTIINGQNNPITKQMTANAKGPVVDLPTLTTGKTTGADILSARLDTLAAQGYGVASISRDVLFANLSNYYIVNYWPVAEYDMGHIEGAIQYTPRADLKLAGFLKTLPTNKTIVVYCYTGQTSSFIAAYLRALGYDAKSLSFGANNLFYDTMPGTKWNEQTEFKNYPVVQ